jgi:type I restriction enzyme S subunit
MSSIDDLIAKMCPNGLEMVSLGALEDRRILKLGRGNVISKSDLATNPGDFPVYSSSASGNGEFGRYGSYMFDDERITWSVDGGGRLFYRQAHRYSVTNVSGWLKVLEPSVVSTKFLYFTLTNLWAKQTYDYTKKAHPSVIRDAYVFPVPPIEVQREIVRILDQFTELEADLEAELEARRKQYEHYRNELLTFPKEEGVRWVPMGELFRIVPTPKGVPRSKYNPTGEIAIVDQGQEQIAGYTNDLSKSISLDKCVVFGDHTRAIKWIDFEFAAGADGTKVLIANDGVLLRFAYFTLLNAEIPDRGYNRHWSVTREIMVAIPPIDKQNEIIQVLDKFDALVNDISVGLPAEISARRKQYEYYRDKLLTFPEAAA